LALVLAACLPAQAQPSSASSLRLIVYNWDGEIPQSVLQAFSEEYDVKIEYKTYKSTEEAVASLRRRDVYDVVVLENRFVGSLIKDHLLAEIDLHRIPNFKNISFSFRDLSFDPGNRYSIPYSWGVVGILAHRNVQPELPAAWADLWDEAYCGRIGVWRGQTRQMISVALKSLGYSVNSENQVELAEAQARLLQLRPCVQFVDDAVVLASLGRILSGELAIGVGHGYEAAQLRDLNIPAEFVIPTEGALLWGDNFVIPASSQQRETAETFINFLLRPEISAAIVNDNSFQIANDAALPLISSKLMHNNALYPPLNTLRNAEFLLPLSPEGERLYTEIGDIFVNAPPS
jgi:spermidine/putrescine transport system substrate-binding protein